MLLKWLTATKYDIVCLQELKTSDEKFPAAAIREAGYGAIWHGQKSYNRVAILSRGADPVERRRGLPSDPDDTHSRYIRRGRAHCGLSLPAEWESGAWSQVRLQAALVRPPDQLRTRVAQTGSADCAVRRPQRHSNPHRRGSAATMDRRCGFPESRQAYAEVPEDGWIDAVRRIHPEKGIYTYWNFSFGGCYDRSSGLRMDHLLWVPSWHRGCAAPG
ncbi:endonuclease/exonuclease/phosphatase family protein [Mesorhizobium sp.]|uniref:endonuclease/exonuclease/phosphatase family protein n=1 Tax=Mesorhizobium sp. TaxID=1871066 RepID=UPI00338E2CC6